MRWVYIKNGDVVGSVMKFEPEQLKKIEAGPDAFLADFLSGVRGNPVLMISWCVKNKRFENDIWRAITYKVSGSKLGRSGNILMRFRATWAAMCEIIRYKPDRVICGRVGPMLWVTAVLSSIMRFQFIHSRHNSLYEEQSGSYHRILSNLDVYAIRKAKAVICHGPLLVDQMREIGVASHRTIEFDVGFSEFQKLAGLSDKNVSVEQNKKFQILYVGRMDRTKGVYHLLEAAESLLNERSDLKLVYVGDGPALIELQRRIKEKGLESQVQCTGRMQHDQLPTVISSSMLMVTPTLREFPEGRCMAAMEALAVGVPVIAPDTGPFPYLVVSEKNGLLYEPDNVSSLKDVLQQAVMNEQLYHELKRGALETAKTIRIPIRTFYEAIEKAFNV